MKTKLFFIVFTFASLFYSCSSDDGGNSTEENITIIVKVVDENNQPISNARITNGSDEITTNSSGIATINNPTETYGKYRFGISKDNHFPGSLNVDPYNVNSEGYTIMLLAASSTETIPNTGGTISGYDWTFTSTGGFVYENGSPVSGNVDIAIRYINPDNLEEIQAAFPGGDFGGVGGGVDLQLYVYGFVAISYTQNGIRVYPAVGSVTITVQVPGVYANAAQNGGKVFYYDEAAQIWEESANPTVSGLNVTMPLPSQTTFCCFGKGYPIATVKYKKSVCDPGDGFLYGVAVEFHADMHPDLLGVTYTSFLYGSSGTWWNEFTTYPIIGYFPFPPHNFSNSEINHFNNNVGEEAFSGLAGFDYGFKIHSIRIPKTEPGLITQSDISDVVILNYPILTAGTTNLGLINKVCTGEIENPHGNTNPTQGQGQFTYDGTNYTGNCYSVNATQCSSGGKDVLLTSSLGNFIIYNIPQASSGTYNFTEFQSGGCNLFVISTVDGNATSTGGTLTKTGSNSFTFSCTLQDISNGYVFTITGSGNYN